MWIFKKEIWIVGYHRVAHYIYNSSVGTFGSIMYRPVAVMIGENDAPY